MTREQSAILKVLSGQQCACKGFKRYAASFCKTCYYVLPPKMRQAHYAPWGEGYEEAYIAAIERLKELGRIER